MLSVKTFNKERVKLLKEKRKNKNKSSAKLDLVTMILSDFKNKAIELKKDPDELTVEELQKVLKSFKKKLEQEKDGLIKANRTEVVNTITEQILYINDFLPKQKSVKEIIIEVKNFKSQGLTKNEIFKEFAKNKDLYNMRDVNEVINKLEKEEE